MNILKKNKSKIVIGIMGFVLSALLVLPFLTVASYAFVYHVPIDVALLIDTSGSMSSKISSEKTAANDFIDKMDSTQDQVSIIPFENYVGSIQQLTSNYPVAKNFVNGIGVGGGTSYLAGLNAAQTELTSARRRAGSMPVIVFMSDGVPFESNATVLAKTDALKAMGIQIYTIYLGSGTSSLLSSMSSSTTGTTDHYFDTPTAADLSQIYTAVANMIQAPNDVFIGTKNGNLTLNTSNLAPNKTVILKVTGTVTIAGNQTNNPNNNGAGYKDISQLSQLIIIANKIVINRAVTNVDAWLIAKGSDGTIQTCDDISTPTINTCNQKLVVNGPVMANHLVLLRTVGSGTGAASNDPAEVFNLRADAYLWATAHSVSYGRAQTVFTTELPPRF